MVHRKNNSLRFKIHYILDNASLLCGVCRMSTKVKLEQHIKSLNKIKLELRDDDLLDAAFHVAKAEYEVKQQLEMPDGERESVPR